MLVSKEALFYLLMAPKHKNSNSNAGSFITAWYFIIILLVLLISYYAWFVN